MSPGWQVIVTGLSLLLTIIVHGLSMARAFWKQQEELKAIGMKLDALKQQGDERHADNQHRMDSLERRMDRFEDRLAHEPGRD